MKKKGLAFLLAASMVLTSFPANIFAEPVSAEQEDGFAGILDEEEFPASNDSASHSAAPDLPDQGLAIDYIEEAEDPQLEQLVVEALPEEDPETLADGQWMEVEEESESDIQFPEEIIPEAEVPVDVTEEVAAQEPDKEPEPEAVAPLVEVAEEEESASMVETTEEEEAAPAVETTVLCGELRAVKKAFCYH